MSQRVEYWGLETGIPEWNVAIFVLGYTCDRQEGKKSRRGSSADSVNVHYIGLFRVTEVG